MRTLVLLVVVALALPASAQDLEARRWIEKKIEVQIERFERCRLEREFGGGGECSPKANNSAETFHPLICEAYLDGRWNGVSCWDD